MAFELLFGCTAAVTCGSGLCAYLTGATLRSRAFEVTLSGIASNVSQGVKVRTDLRELGDKRYLHVVVMSADDRAIEDWALEIRLPDAVVGICGATSDPLGSLSYRIKPDPWTRHIPRGGKVEFGVVMADAA
ncbi:MAG: hypothetical protein AAFW98_15690 [Pseudomonadota bacterium]